MTRTQSKEKEILRDLGDGLILRRAKTADAEALASFNAWVHGNMEKNEPDERVGAWTRDLLERPHPRFEAGDFTIVEDSRNGKIVSSLNLISQTWAYAGIEFGVGRPELVGTHPDYRNRGLVRAQFEVVHRWSAARSEMMQAITGIPYYYRQFGYEMALSLGGGRLGYLPHVPKLNPGEAEPYQVRPAADADLDFIAQLYRQANQRSLVSCVWDEALWLYELNGKSPKNVNRYALRIIEKADGEKVGYLAHPPYAWGPTMVATAYELKAGISYAAVTPSVIRYLQDCGETYIAESKGKEVFGAFGFWLGTEHPVYEVIPDRLPRVRKPYAWYLRIPDLPGFIQHIAPVLEKRLSQSAMPDHSGELKISFYRTGLKMDFEKGKLCRTEVWQPAPQGHSGDALFPNLTFLQLLFGYRSLEELRYAFADCGTDNDDATALLNILFPKQHSDVWPIA